MWNKHEVAQAIGLLTSFMNECWQIDKVKEAETFYASINVLEKQLKMLNSFEQSGIKEILRDKLIEGRIDEEDI